MKIQTKRKATHPEFSYCIVGSTVSKYHLVFIFERQMWRTPTEEQIADYIRRKLIVEENGGYMETCQYQVAGKQPPFTDDECKKMVKSVKAANKDLTVTQKWNGSGYYSFSVSAKKRT